jgi:hypothetical protein
MAKKLTASQVKARLADPGKRSTIPTSQLPAKYKAMRARAVASKKATATLDDPAALTAPLTPRGLAEQVTAGTDLAYSAPTQELAGQRGVNAQMQANIPTWFDGYQASLARATAVQQAATANAVAAQQNAADTTSALDTAQQGTQQAAMAADAQKRGASVDPQIAATAQQAAMARRGSADAFTGLTAGLGAATTGLAANREVVGAGQRVTAQQAERNVGLNLDKTARALATDKGNYATTFRQKLIDAEHTKTLENKAFGLDAEKAAADVRTDRAKIKAKASVDKAKLALDKERLRAQNEMDAATRSNNHARIKIATENLKIAKRRVAAYEKGQSTSAAGGVTVAEARRRNDAVAKIGGDYAKALAAARRAMQNPKLASPSGIGRALDTLYPKLPTAARNKIIGQATGKVTPAQRSAYQKFLDDLRAGKISY